MATLKNVEKLQVLYTFLGSVLSRRVGASSSSRKKNTHTSIASRIQEKVEKAQTFSCCSVSVCWRENVERMRVCWIRSAQKDKKKQKACAANVTKEAQC